MRRKGVWRLVLVSLALAVIGWFCWPLVAAVTGDEEGAAERRSERADSDSHHRVRLLTGASKESEGLANGGPEQLDPDADATGPIIPVYPRRGAELVEIASYHPRPADEWQGALVPNAPQDMAHCETSLLCGLALACRDGLCGACVENEDCGEGERCVLDHCLLAVNVECTTKGDCREGEFCLFQDSDSPGPRNNAHLTAVCWSSETAPQREQIEVQSNDGSESAGAQVLLVDSNSMLDSLKANAK